MRLGRFFFFRLTDKVRRTIGTSLNKYPTRLVRSTSLLATSVSRLEALSSLRMKSMLPTLGTSMMELLSTLRQTPSYPFATSTAIILGKQTPLHLSSKMATTCQQLFNGSSAHSLRTITTIKGMEDMCSAIQPQLPVWAP